MNIMFYIKISFLNLSKKDETYCAVWIFSLP